MRWCLLMVPLLLVLLLVLLVAAAVGAAGRGRTPAAARLRRQHKTRLHHHPSSLRQFDDVVASVSAVADTVRRKTLTCEGVTTRALKAGLLSTEGDILAVARGIDAAGSVPRSAGCRCWSSTHARRRLTRSSAYRLRGRWCSTMSTGGSTAAP